MLMLSWLSSQADVFDVKDGTQQLKVALLLKQSQLRGDLQDVRQKERSRSNSSPRNSSQKFC
jgi:hypothetical protein